MAASRDGEPSAERRPAVIIDMEASAARCSACGNFIASCAWVDIILGMAMNASQQSTANLRIPSPEHRLYRMSLALPREWKQRSLDGVWRSPRGFTRQVPRSLLMEVSGYWDAARMGQEAMPPLNIECPHCSLVQFVAAQRRRGGPAAPSS